jgi:glycerol-3-phosphate cytidylyltransferase
MIRSRVGLKVGITASSFDLGPHAGHIAMLEEAKRHCDYLIVALHVNPALERPEVKNKPEPTVSERYISAAANRFVDEVIPYETEAELINLIELIRPQIRFLGEDYKERDFTGKSLGIELYYCSRKHSASSSGLRKKIAEAEALKVK